MTPNEMLRSPLKAFVVTNAVMAAPVYENVRPMLLDGAVKEESRFHRTVYRRVGGPSGSAALLTVMSWLALGVAYVAGYRTPTVYGLPWEAAAAVGVFALYVAYASILAPEEELVEEIETTPLGAFRLAAFGIEPPEDGS